MKLSYSKEEFINAVKSSISIAESLKKLNLEPKGGNYRTFKKLAKKFNVDVSHFLGQGHNKGKSFGPKRPIEDYLSNKYSIKSNTLRIRLIKEGFFEHKCYECKNTSWNNKPIPLELEHKDGNHHNNNLSNLTLLCPNCHAQTDTYRGRNIKFVKTKYKNRTKNNKTTQPINYKVQNLCIDCGNNINKRSTRCRSCAQFLKNKSITKRPKKEALVEDLSNLSYCAIGKKYNVSDNAVRKWCKFYQISK